MKVLLVIDTLGASGAERQLLSLLPGLKAYGISVEVAALFPPYDVSPALNERGIPTHHLDIPHRWAFLHGVSRLRQLVRAGEFDLVWSTLFFAQVHSALMRTLFSSTPLILWHQSPGYTKPVYVGLIPKCRSIIHGWACRVADAAIACSVAVAEDYQRSFGTGPLPVIYNAVPPEALPEPISAEMRNDVRGVYGAGDSRPLLTIAARYSPDKGHGQLIDSLSILKKRGIRFVCIAAGRGPLEAALRAQADQLGLADDIRFVGLLPQLDLFRLMQSSDAVILSSIQESLGLAAIEAMALGTPTVVTDYYGLSELAAGGAAFTAAPSDPASLAEAIELAISDEGARVRVAQRAKVAVAANFVVPVILPRWADALHTAAKLRESI